jgi:membrane protein DedA with SNARE-associated domain
MIAWFNSMLAVASIAVIQGGFGTFAALLGVAALTELGIPFPLIIDGALFIASYERGLFSFQVLLVILALVLGREAGAAAIFWLSRIVGDRFVSWLEKLFPKLKLSERMAWLKTKLRRRALLAVAVARLTPGLLFPSSVVSGYCGMKFYQFVLGIVLASVVADGVLVIIGVVTKFGLHIIGFTPSAAEVLVVLFVIILLVWLVQRIYVRARNQQRARNPPWN